jgi:hypothetical protein
MRQIEQHARKLLHIMEFGKVTGFGEARNDPENVFALTLGSPR